MPEALNCLGDNAIFFGRRPEKLLEFGTSRRLAINNTPPYKFAYARTALKYGLKARGFKPGDVLLVPDLICESVLEPLDALGFSVTYYPVDHSLEPEWGRMKGLLTPQTRALLLVHYFGQPRSIAQSLAFCREKSLLLIEDNAHGFGATYNGQLLGTFGEIGISAPRKSFPIQNGALLHLAGSQRPDVTSLQLQPSADRSFWRRVKKWLQLLAPAALLGHRRAGVEFRRRLGQPLPYGSQEAFRDLPLARDYGMDADVESFLAEQNLAYVGTIRRRIYRIWEKWTKTQGLVPVFPELAAGAVPLVFPAWAKSAADSLQWYERGHRAGVDIHSWPTLPQTIVKENGGAMRCWERLVCFPIHQEMDMQMLERRLTLL